MSQKVPASLLASQRKAVKQPPRPTPAQPDLLDSAIEEPAWPETEVGEAKEPAWPEMVERARESPAPLEPEVGGRLPRRLGASAQDYNCCAAAAGRVGCLQYSSVAPAGHACGPWTHLITEILPAP